MMLRLKYLFLSLALTPLLAQATLFDFSYTFQSGYGDDRGIEATTVQGSFNGDADGLFVKNLTDIKVNIQGRDFSSPISSIATTENPWDTSIEGIVSFDINLNKFMFVDSDFLNTGSYTSYFYIRNISNTTQRQASNDNGGYSYGFDDDSSLNSSWKLEVHEVPEPQLLLLLLGGIATISARRLTVRKN